MAEDHSTNGWDEWRNHVLRELERVGKSVSELEKSNDARVEAINLESKKQYDILIEKLNEIKLNNTRDITELKTKAKAYGTVAGFVASILTAVASSVFGVK